MPKFFGLELLLGFEYRAWVKLRLLIPSGRAGFSLVEPNRLDHSCQNLAYFFDFRAFRLAGF